MKDFVTAVCVTAFLVWLPLVGHDVNRIATALQDMNDRSVDISNSHMHVEVSPPPDGWPYISTQTPHLPVPEDPTIKKQQEIISSLTQAVANQAKTIDLLKLEVRLLDDPNFLAPRTPGPPRKSSSVSQHWIITGGHTADGQTRNDCVVPPLISSGRNPLEAITLSGITVWTEPEWQAADKTFRPTCGATP